MLVFRDGKSEEEEIKAWQFWHHRQHSVKQRIIDVDTKNSLGLVGHIEELSHNALAVYWNPLESPAKVNLAVQCLSTDFSTQKGVKGLPLHVQIDTFDDPRADIMDRPTHRAYCQVKIFCDKGAERKLRDEERRAAKRRMTPSGKRRLDEMYHETFDRSEFYSMSDLSKTPILFLVLWRCEEYGGLAQIAHGVELGPVKGFVVHLVQPSLPARSHPPLCGSPLLVSQLSLRSFVAEDLHLAVPSVGRSVHDVGTRIVEGVDLDVQRKPLDALLGAEVRGEALHSQVHLRWRLQRVPVDSKRIMR